MKRIFASLILCPALFWGCAESKSENPVEKHEVSSGWDGYWKIDVDKSLEAMKDDPRVNMDSMRDFLTNNTLVVGMADGLLEWDVEGGIRRYPMRFQITKLPDGRMTLAKGLLPYAQYMLNELNLSVNENAFSVSLSEKGRLQIAPFPTWSMNLVLKKHAELQNGRLAPVQDCSVEKDTENKMPDHVVRAAIEAALSGDYDSASSYATEDFAEDERRARSAEGFAALGSWKNIVKDESPRAELLIISEKGQAGGADVLVTAPNTTFIFNCELSSEKWKNNHLNTRGPGVFRRK